MTVRVGLSLLLGFALPAVTQELRLQTIAEIPIGSHHRNFACGDFDCEGLGEIAFKAVYEQASGWDIWRLERPGALKLVFRKDSLLGDPFIPADVGLVDEDGRPDLVGISVDERNRYLLQVLESQVPLSLPTTCVWSQAYDSGGIYSDSELRLFDLDGDARLEIMLKGGGVFRGYRNPEGQDNTYMRFFAQRLPGGAPPLGDFDRDGKVEGAFSGVDSVSVYSFDAAPDSFQLVWQDSLDFTIDVFGGEDTDGDSFPEFFANRLESAFPGVNWWLYRYELAGPGHYDRVTIDSVMNRQMMGVYYYTRSSCGDLDGDGLAEIAWSLGDEVRAYDFAGGRYELAWTRHLPPLPMGDLVAYTKVADFDKDGQRELFITRQNYTGIFRAEMGGISDDPRRGVSSGTLRLQVHPNPCSGILHISVSLGSGCAASTASIAIYDASGRLVRRLARAGYCASEMRLSWDGNDESGRPVPQGMYFIRLSPLSRCVAVIR